MLIAWLLPLLLTGPTSERISPPEGGTVWWATADLSFVIGHSPEAWPGTYGVNPRIWVWSAATGVRWLDELVTLPPGQNVERIFEGADAYGFIVQIVPPGVAASSEGPVTFGPTEMWLVRLPKEPWRWFKPGDVNMDGAVTTADMLMIHNRIGWSPTTQPACDLNDDGRIDMSDLAKVKTLIGAD